MKVLVAKHAGFCIGVERAFKIALQEAGNKPLFMLGNLVHNKQVVDRLKAQGVISVSALSEIPPGTSGTLLISAHGVSPEIYAEAEKLSLKIVDTTCPWVKKAQKIAFDLGRRGCQVIIVGDRGHAEVKGLLGWSRGHGIVIQNLSDLEKLSIDKETCLGVLAQTTQAEERFQRLTAELKQRQAAVEVHNTICGATSQRQNAAAQLAKQVELMLVIGDKMSANTTRLTELCAQTGTETHQIETLQEMNKEWLKNKVKIGVTAGASTPEWVTNEVLGFLRSL
ncbi:MAG: 4-hydroxy-3-methylbut-2-enyl diphosphate reductase [Candidatus Margulisiibacteriota bacterium]|jgi:4-hydroxy-3-methylbut-2-enyl diphosphate reductase